MRELSNLISFDQVVDGLIAGAYKVDDLNFENKIHKNAFLRYIKRMPNSSLNKLSTENEMTFLKYALEEDYKNFIYLNKSQYNDEIASIFLNGILKEKNRNNSGFVVKQTYDDKISFVVKYETMSGEDIQYFDKELEIPSSIVSKFFIHFKVNKVVKFIESLDLDVRYIGPNAIFSTFTSWIKTSFQEAVIEMLTKHNSSFYQVNANINELKELTSKKITNMFGGGISVQLFDFVNFNLSSDILQQLSQQAFDNRQNKERLNFELYYQEQSMKIYGQKMEIENKNPQASHSLTEAEKDKALERYLIKTGKLSFVNGTYTPDTLNDRTVSYKDEETEKESDEVLRVVAPKNLRARFIVIVSIFLATSIALICLGNEFTFVGLILAGVVLLVSALVGFFGRRKFKLNREAIRMYKEKVKFEEGRDVK